MADVTTKPKQDRQTGIKELFGCKIDYETMIDSKKTNRLFSLRYVVDSFLVTEQGSGRKARTPRKKDNLKSQIE